MDEATYKTWWNLHRRAARGEALNPEETAAYARGLEALDREEMLDGNLAQLHQAREAVKQAEARHAELQARHTTLATQIAALEMPRTSMLE
jgi:phosphoketolase